MAMMNAAAGYHFGAGGPEVSAEDIDQIRNFFAPKSYCVFANWNFNGDLMHSRYSDDAEPVHAPTRPSGG